MLNLVAILDLGDDIHAQVREMRNAESVRKFMYTDHIISEEEHAKWLASLAGNDKQRVLIALRDGHPVGLVSVNNINTTHRTAEWAFYLKEDQRGKGLGSFLEYSALELAFYALGIEKLSCEVIETNRTVIRLHQRFGFLVEGTFREHIIKDGKRIDVLRLGILKHEWNTRRMGLKRAMDRISHSPS